MHQHLLFISFIIHLFYYSTRSPVYYIFKSGFSLLQFHGSWKTVSIYLSILLNTYLCVSVYSYQYLSSSICPFYWSWFFTISYFLFYIIFIISLLSFYTSFIALYFIFTDIHNNVSVYINNDIFIFFMPQILSLLLFIDTAWVS